MIGVVLGVSCPGDSCLARNYPGRSCPGMNCTCWEVFSVHHEFHSVECPRMENVLGWQLSCDVFPRDIHLHIFILNCRLRYVNFH